MKCPHCGKEIPDASRFCKFCGGPLEEKTNEQTICPNCGAPVDAGYKFCGKCGHTIETPEPSMVKSGVDNAAETNGVHPGVSASAGGDFSAHAGNESPRYASFGDNYGGAYSGDPAGAVALTKSKSKKKKIIIAAAAVVLVCAAGVTTLFATGVLGNQSCYVVTTLKIYLDSGDEYSYTYDDRGTVQKFEAPYYAGNETYESNDKGLITKIIFNEESMTAAPTTFKYHYDSGKELPSGRTETVHDSYNEYIQETEYTYHSNKILSSTKTEYPNSDIDSQRYDEEGWPTYWEDGGNRVTYKISRSKQEGDEVLKISGSMLEEDVDLSLRIECDENENIKKG